MATASFNPVQFLAKISPDLLMQYADSKGIKIKIDAEKAGEDAADALLEVIGELPENKRAECWLDISDIDDMGRPTACDYVLRQIAEKGSQLDADAYKELKNNKERAMYLFLNYYDIFAETHDIYDVENKQGWSSEKVVSKSADEVVVNISDLEDELKIIYSKEFKGRNVKVKKITKPDRIIFIAFIEDSPTNDISFDNGKLNPRHLRRPVFTAYFIYRSEEGVLDVKATGGKRRVKQLKIAFIEKMLETEALLNDGVRYDFDRFKNLQDVSFPHQRTDLLSSVTLTALRLVSNTTKAAVFINVNRNATGEGVEPMIKALEHAGIDLFDYGVTQFKLAFVFDNPEGGRQRKVTATLSHPNRCDLKEREQDMKVRELLKRWKLDLY